MHDNELNGLTKKAHSNAHIPTNPIPARSNVPVPVLSSLALADRTRVPDFRLADTADWLPVRADCAAVLCPLGAELGPCWVRETRLGEGESPDLYGQCYGEEE